MSDTRRHCLQTLGALGGLALSPMLSQAAQAAVPDAGQPPLLEPIPALPPQVPAGRPGEFDFLQGQWRIEHWRLEGQGEAARWQHFSGEARCWSILDGAGSIEELRIPARQFSGMGLRLLERESARWSDFWVNARSGVLSTPGLQGGFVDGSGFFWAADGEPDAQGRREIALGLWDQITPQSCRWRQAVSNDGGQHWAQNWVMHWRRA